MTIAFALLVAAFVLTSPSSSAAGGIRACRSSP
jgi:hypothetical protein